MKHFFIALAALAAGCSSAPKHVIADPEVRFVVWGLRDPAQLESDWRSLFANGVLDRLNEYGVHDGRLGPTTTAHLELGAGELSDVWIGEELLTEITPAPEVIYVLVLPDGATSPWLRLAHSRGYHTWVGVPYAVAPNDEDIISHEIYEAATNPDGQGYRWGLATEVGDLCEGLTEEIGGVTVQQVWSQAQQKCE